MRDRPAVFRRMTGLWIRNALGRLDMTLGISEEAIASLIDDAMLSDARQNIL